jgi:hypothetical protein
MGIYRGAGGTENATPVSILNTLSASGGSALIGFLSVGTAAVASTVQAKLRLLEVCVDEYGADEDVADNASAIEAADTALTEGGTLVFGKNKTYNIASTAQIKKANKVDLNGSTLKATSALTAQMILFGEELASYDSGDFTAFSVTRNAGTFTIPSGVSLERGNVVKLMSNTVRLTPTSGSNYTHGQWVIITAVSGSTAYVSTPFYDTFQVDSIDVWKGKSKMEFFNGTLDLTEIAAAANFSEGILARGSNIKIHHVNAFGNDNAGNGIRTDGENALVEDCLAAGFLNLLGEPSGGRIGYGIAVYGNNSVVRRSTGAFCKHGIASAGRDAVAVNVRYENCNGIEDTTFVSGKYSGTLDIHSNVTGVVEIVNCNVTGQFRLLSLRAPCKVKGGKYKQTIGGQLVESFDTLCSDTR